MRLLVSDSQSRPCANLSSMDMGCSGFIGRMRNMNSSGQSKEMLVSSWVVDPRSPEEVKEWLATYGVTDDWYGPDGFIKKEKLDEYVEVAKRILSSASRE